MRWLIYVLTFCLYSGLGATEKDYREELYQKAAKNCLGFWEKQADCLEWFEPWKEVLDWNPPYAKWFTEGKLNACYNCLDRHLKNGKGKKTAIIWEGERGEERSLTYEQLYEEVNKFSNALKSLGIQKGDKVAIYLPMIPEAVISMLSCARIGAIHTVVFGGFSSEALKDRIQDAEAKLLITADSSYRKGKILKLREAAEKAVVDCPTVEHTILIKTENENSPLSAKQLWYADLMEKANPCCSPEVMDSEDMLFLLYTSGTTGKPKGIIHTTGGYMVGTTLTTKWVFDIKENDIYWCTADIGWITGHSYNVYGPLSNGMTIFLYEGSPDQPQKDRYWKLIEKYGITILYTAPTAIRTFMKWGDEWPSQCDLSSLRILGSVGEPINPKAWEWYFDRIGNRKCPIVDTWWQTETGSIMIAPMANLTELKPGSATIPLPGIEADILDIDGQQSTQGYLAITSPWPSMLRGVYKAPERYQNTYWSKWNGKYYFTGDGSYKDEEGYFWLTGRVDDIINVSGHRLGTMEIESALIDHPFVAEAAAIAINHEIKGQAIVCFVTLKESVSAVDLEAILKQHVVIKIGAFARPEKIIFVAELPKTRSGKIMRRLLRDIAEGKILGDTTSLADPAVMEEIKKEYY